MDFELTDDQVALQEGVRAFIDGRFSLDDVRVIEAAGRLDRERWRELGETGVFSITLPEADGGLELGVSEAALVFEELGRALVPGPLVATLLAAALDRRCRDRRDDRRAVRAGHAGVGGRASRPTSTRCFMLAPTTACAASTPQRIATTTGRAPGRRAHAARGSSTATCLPAS